MSGTWSDLKPIAKALSQNLSWDALLQSPFCARTYALSLARVMSSPYFLQQAIEANDTTLFNFITGYLKLLSQTATLNPELDRQLFISECRCESVLKSLPKEFHIRNPFSGSLLDVNIGLRCEKMGSIGDMASFVEVIADYLDRVIGGGLQSLVKTMPKARSLERKLVAFIRENAKPLAKMMTTWLKHSSSIFVFALFGTMMDFEDNALFSQLQALPEFLKAFDDRLHALVKGGHESQLRSRKEDWLRLDLVFHGAGGFAGAFCSSLRMTRQRAMTRSYFLVSAKKRCADICELLSFANRANRYVQGGTVADLPRLAHFAQELCNLTKEPTPSLVSLIISQNMPADDENLGLHHLFNTLICFKDKCYNPTAHTSSENFRSRQDFTIALRKYTPKGECLQTCSKCKAVYYCSSDCQRQDWKHGTPPHKTLCASLAKMKAIEVNHAHGVGLQGLREWEEACRSFDFDLPQERIFQYIYGMLAYFSESVEMDMAKAKLAL